MLRAVSARSIRGRCSSSSVVCVVRRIHIDNGDDQRTTSRRRYRRIGGAEAQTPALWHESGPSTSSARMDGTTHTMPTRTSSLPLHWSVQLKTGRHFSRRLLVLLAEQCLREESPLLYRVHRQGVEAQSTPQDFLQLIRLLASAGLAMDVGARVVALLLDALHKTPHPVRGALSAWDLEDDEMRQVKADAMAVIANASDGTAALAWLSAVLMPAEEMDPVPTTSSSSSSSIPSITHLVLARLDAVAAGNARQLVLRGVDEDGDALLLHPLLLTAVCRAMVRSSPQVQAQVLHLLERCASTRFVCGSDVHLVFGQLNVEELIVASAEAAALMGETELVTRLIFLMYRFRGLLGQSSLGAPSTNTGSGESSGWLTRLRARISTTWRSETAMEAEINAYFEAAVVRLLRSAIAAVLRSAPNDDVLEGGGSTPSLQEALVLLSGLSTSSTCAGQAAMTMELLHFLGHEQQQRFSIMRGSNTVVDASVAQHVEHTKATALGVVEKLARRVQVSCRAFPTQKEELQEMLVVCVVEAIRVFIPEIHDEKESFLATFLPQKMHDAKDVLQLIHMVDVAHRVTLLPSVMAVASQCWLHKDEPSLIHTSAEKDQMQHLIREVLRCANLLHDGGTMWLWWSMLHAMAPTASPLRYWQAEELSRGASVEMLCRETSVHQRRRLWRFLRHTLPQMPRAVCALHGALLAQAATSIISTRTSCAASTTTLHEEEELLHLLYRCGDVSASVVRAANRLVCAMLDGSSLLTFSMTDLWSGCGRAAMEHIIVCVDPRLLSSQSPVSLRSNITRSMAELPGGVLASFAALIAAPLLRFSNTRQRTSTVQVTYVLSSSSVSLMARDASPLVTVEEDDVVVVDALHFHQQQPTHYNSSSLARPFLRALVQHHDGDPLSHTEAVEGGVVEWCVRIASPWHLTQHNECHGGVEEAADAARAVMQSMEHHVKLPASNTKVVVWSEEEEEERSVKLHSAVKLTSVRRAQSAKAQCEIGRILRDGGDVRRAQRPHTRVAATNNANRVSSLLDSLERSKAARRSPSS